MGLVFKNIYNFSFQLALAAGISLDALAAMMKASDIAAQRRDAALALLIGAPQARRDELVGGQAPRSGHLVGTLQAAKAGHGRPGDVDVVGRAQ